MKIRRTIRRLNVITPFGWAILTGAALEIAVVAVVADALR